MDATWILLAATALFAGFIDAVAGGGGLVQVPALLTAFPGESPATLFGTNKGASIFGTANAAWRYARRIAVPWGLAGPAAAAAFAFAWLGAAAVAWLPRDILRPVILVLLVLVTAYTAMKKDLGMGSSSAPPAPGMAPWAALAGGVIGFYDGFFGPGTGSFLIFVFVRFFALDFLRASAVAKVVNVATNAAALAYFAPNGHGIWGLALLMAAFNVAGATVGSHLALSRGSGFVRQVFLLVATVLTAKFGYDTFH